MTNLSALARSADNKAFEKTIVILIPIIFLALIVYSNVTGREPEEKTDKEYGFEKVVVGGCATAYAVKLGDAREVGALDEIRGDGIGYYMHDTDSFLRVEKGYIAEAAIILADTDLKRCLTNLEEQCGIRIQPSAASAVYLDDPPVSGTEYAAAQGLYSIDTFEEYDGCFSYAVKDGRCAILYIGHTQKAKKALSGKEAAVGESLDLRGYTILQNSDAGEDFDPDKVSGSVSVGETAGVYLYYKGADFTKHGITAKASILSYNKDAEEEAERAGLPEAGEGASWGMVRIRVEYGADISQSEPALPAYAASDDGSPLPYDGRCYMFEEDDGMKVVFFRHDGRPTSFYIGLNRTRVRLL